MVVPYRKYVSKIMAENEAENNLKCEKVLDYIPYVVFPMKFVGFWDWFPNPEKEYQVVINNYFLCVILFVLINLPIALAEHLYADWIDVMDSLVKIADALVLLTVGAIVAYVAAHKRELHKLIKYMNENFVYHSANGLTNMTMWQSYRTAKIFALLYGTCAMCSVTMYLIAPLAVHLWTKQEISQWMYKHVTNPVLFAVVFLRQAMGQAFVGLALGQFAAFYSANCILICGQLDVLCCSLRNARYTALLKKGVQYEVLVSEHSDILDDEKHRYIYSSSEMKKSAYHYDEKVNYRFMGKRREFDIYSDEFDEATVSALSDCARVCQTIFDYKEKFEAFVSPILAIRVIQVTMYLCALLYAATVKFNLMTIEYLAAASLDMFLYCYFGNQINVQADRVSTATYQSAWHTMGARPRRVLLNILLANKRPLVIRAGKFLPMNLNTYAAIVKTSFSYYTLLVKVSEKE